MEQQPTQLSTSNLQPIVCEKCGQVNDDFKIKEFEEEKEQNSSLIL